MEQTQIKVPKTRWHRLLGKMFEELLTPVGIEVYPEFPVMAGPPEADILLLRRETPQWTPEQMQRLPDGIRDSRADHILIEFKYTESAGLPAFRQSVGYDYFYKISKKLTDRHVHTFLVSSKTVADKTLARFGYSQADKSGVNHSRYPLLDAVSLLTLNDLSDEPHNAYIKCFASRMQVKKAAFKILDDLNIGSVSHRLVWFLQGLLKYWFSKGGVLMQQELTPEQVMEDGKLWGDFFLKNISVEERLKGLKPEERLKGMSVQEIEAYLRKLKEEK
ncbi:hypothetical protein QUF90_09425 [Desulfococcaceae bacterium HSG9]|nr:hypothetical protein [Desulfococcaceae bacterium HSG9]